MIDVSKFTRGERCPRCSGRRVFAVDLERNLWCCVPNAVPFPRRDQTIEHDAVVLAEDDAEYNQVNGVSR